MLRTVDLYFCIQSICIVQVPSEDKRAELSQQLHQLIDIVEELNREGEYGGSPEAMYALIERCADERPTDSVLALMDYRANVCW